MRIYLAGPLFTSAEQAFNLELASNLMELGHDVFLPQRDCPPMDQKGPNGIAEACLQGIRSADAVVAILDGPDADSGTCVELGYAHAYNELEWAATREENHAQERPPKVRCLLGVRTDFRKGGDSGEAPVNLMIPHLVHRFLTFQDKNGSPLCPTPKDVAELVHIELGLLETEL